MTQITGDSSNMWSIKVNEGDGVYLLFTESGLMPIPQDKVNQIFFVKGNRGFLTLGDSEKVMEFSDIAYIEPKMPESGKLPEGEKYVICDCEDGEIFKEGSSNELKEYWWDLINRPGDVGGYALLSREEYDKEFEKIHKPEPGKAVSVFDREEKVYVVKVLGYRQQTDGVWVLNFHYYNGFAAEAYWNRDKQRWQLF